MTLLTPNFSEKNKSPELTPQGDAAAGAAKVHIVEAHEPLKSNPFGGLTNVQLTPPPSFSMGEQTVNVAPVAKPEKKIAIVGTAPSSRMLAPFNDPSWTIWVCSPGNQNIMPRVDAWFEVHANLLWPEYKHYGEPYILWLNQQKFPIYMQDQSVVKNAIIFPKDEMVEEFGPYFFTSSFSWMMAFAIKQGATEVALFGVDMASREEYIIQRPGAYHFFMEGARRGCKIWAPYESDIMQPPGLYGYSEVTPFGRKVMARRSELQQRLAGMKQQFTQLQHDIPYLEGALEDTDYYQSIHLGAQDNSEGTKYLEKVLQQSKPPASQG